MLPGDRDARLAWSAECRCSVATTLGAELALAVELLIDTGAGLRPGPGRAGAQSRRPVPLRGSSQLPGDALRPAHPGGAAPVGAPPPEGGDRSRHRLAGRHGTARRPGRLLPLHRVPPGVPPAGPFVVAAARPGDRHPGPAAAFPGAAFGPIGRVVHPARDPGAVHRRRTGAADGAGRRRRAPHHPGPVGARPRRGAAGPQRHRPGRGPPPVTAGHAG